MHIQCPGCSHGYDFPVELATEELSVTCAQCGLPFFVGRYGVRLPGSRRPLPPTAPPTDGRHLDSGLFDVNALEEALHQNIRQITHGAAPVAPEPDEDSVMASGSLGAALFRAPTPKPSPEQRLLAQVHQRPRPQPRPLSAPLPPPVAPGEVWTGPLPPLPRPAARSPQPRRPVAPPTPVPEPRFAAPSTPPPLPGLAPMTPMAAEPSSPPPLAGPVSEPPAPPKASPPPPPPPPAAPAAEAPSLPAQPAVDPAVIAGFGATPSRVGGPPSAWATGEQPARPVRATPATPKAPNARPVKAIGAAALCVAALGGWWWLTREPAPTPEPAPQVARAAEPAAPAPSAAPSAPASVAEAPASAPPSEAPIPDMARRHRPGELRQAFTAALEGEDGKVLDIDCEELPCVLYGQVKDFADTVRLFSAEPLAPYRTDRRFIYRWNAGGGSDGAPAERRFAIALMPRNIPDDQMELARQSVLRRYRQARQQPATAQR